MSERPLPTYDVALADFFEWTRSESLRRHAFAVEAGMKFYAEKFGEDEHLWRLTGLLHDMDYERHPSTDEHPFVGVNHLREQGFPEEICEAILGHATYSGVPRKSLLAKTLFAVDELAGFILAVAYVRPNGLSDLTPKSVRKKLKDRAFAAAVSRDDILQGAAGMEIDLNDHIANVIEALKRDAPRLGFEAKTAT